MMTRGVAYVFKVIMFTAGTYTFLASGRARIRALVKTEEYVFKLIHPGVGK